MDLDCSLNTVTALTPLDFHRRRRPGRLIVDSDWARPGPAGDHLSDSESAYRLAAD